MITILYILLPPDNLDITRSEKRDSEFSDDVLLEETGEETDPDFIKKIESRKQWLRFVEILRHPFRYFISDYQNGMVAGCMLALITTLFWMNGTLAVVFPSFTFEIFICLVIILFMLPILIAYEARKIYVNNVERQLPEFLREIADMKDVGMTLQGGAIGMVSNSKLGVLSSELKIVSEDLKWGGQAHQVLLFGWRSVSALSR
ncbi:hypothetical protein [Methanogenium cariaci]|uniref:hypothetical protein n=1 Tax=Methanogenium cariaci TaxID=2197 RepID=UPI001FE00E16|nr:hypothetical protein [Methanogenium cariaci]